jgi:hypothetical protein
MHLRRGLSIKGPKLHLTHMKGMKYVKPKIPRKKKPMQISSTKRFILS